MDRRITDGFCVIGSKCKELLEAKLLNCFDAQVLRIVAIKEQCKSGNFLCYLWYFVDEGTRCSESGVSASSVVMQSKSCVATS